MKPTKTFASDNSASVHPKVLDAIVQANQGHALAYGDDPHTESAISKFREHFGESTQVAFVYNGTGANVIALKAMTQPFHAVLCADHAHANVDECNAPEAFTGCKLIPIHAPDGKLTPESIQPHLKGFGDEHRAQPGAVTLTQTTEVGTIYTPKEIRAIADLAHEHGMLVHMDGARIANAAASLDLPLGAITADVGVDILSFGGTKNGLMFGEAIVVFQPELSEYLRYFRKQCTQLHSKMRFIAVQFNALLSDGLWLDNALHANRMAQRLADRVRDIPGITLTQPVEANGVFAEVPKGIISTLQERYYFYVWDEPTSVVRWMTAFDTMQEDIDGFVDLIRQALDASIERETP